MPLPLPTPPLRDTCFAAGLRLHRAGVVVVVVVVLLLVLVLALVLLLVLMLVLG